MKKVLKGDKLQDAKFQDMKNTIKLIEDDFEQDRGDYATLQPIDKYFESLKETAGRKHLSKGSPLKTDRSKNL